MRQHPLRRYGLAALCISSSALVAAVSYSYITGTFACPLCLIQRAIHGASLLVGLWLFALPPHSHRLRPLGCLLVMLYVANSITAFYHAGIEWRWWEESGLCRSEALLQYDSVEAFTASLDAIKPSCAISSTFIGLSWAVWNIMLSFSMAMLGYFAFRRVTR